MTTGRERGGEWQKWCCYLVSDHLLTFFARLRSDSLALEVRELHRPTLIAIPLCKVKSTACECVSTKGS